MQMGQLRNTTLGYKETSPWASLTLLPMRVRGELVRYDARQMRISVVALPYA